LNWEKISFSFSKFVDILNIILKWVLIFIITEMTAVVFLQVIFRFILKSSLPWSEELARYSMIWMVMLAAGLGFSSGEHIGLDVIVDRMKGTSQKLIKLLSYVIIGLFDITLIRWGWEIMGRVGLQRSPAMRIPMKWPYLAIPLGGIIILIQLIKLCLELFNQGGEEV